MTYYSSDVALLIGWIIAVIFYHKHVINVLTQETEQGAIHFCIEKFPSYEK